MIHKEPLIAASYDGKAISYSIHTKKNEAYSTMTDQVKTSAKRYVDVMQSRKLIDGIWESVPSVFSSISITNCCGIRYINPSVDSSKTDISSDDKLQSSLKSLFFDKYPSIIPDASFSNEECITLYNELIHRIEDICLSFGWDFDKGSLDEWLIQITVEDLLSDIAPDLLKKVISNINFLEKPNNIEVDLFQKYAALIITAYIITDSKYLSEAFDYSLISHFYNHNNRNSIFSFQTILNRKDFNIYHPYINYYIFHSLVMKLYKYKLKEIEENNNLIYQKEYPILMDIPEYIIVSRDLYFDIYEID